jgi:cysteine desulfurase
MSFWSKKRIYLDYASATPVAPEVLSAMQKYFDKDFYNPSAIYAEGVKVNTELLELRKCAAKLLHVSHKDIIFTSGGTESDNLAILGVFEAASASLKLRRASAHIITLNTEHPAILETVYEAQRRGAELTILETDEEGKVSPEDIKNALKENTVLVTLSYASSEVGTIQHIGKIGRIIREFRKQNDTAYPYLHVDASQAASTIDIDAEALNTDLITLDGGKIYSPKGSGLLIVRPGVTIRPQIVGGGQEKGLRSGTESMSLIGGLVKALEILDKNREEDKERYKLLKELFISELATHVPEAKVNGSRNNSLENIVSITTEGKLHEFLAIKLDKEGVMVSTGSSCSSRKNEEDKEALRFSFGRKTTESDIKTTIRKLKSVLL